jgi:DNA-binding response OmpR family regulator
MSSPGIQLSKNVMIRLLVVDDEPSMVMGLKDNLEFEGYSVETASDGTSALNSIRTNSFDLVVMDVMMPGLSGFDVCKTLRAENNATPILLLTARGQEMDRVLGLELGADDYITKPFSLRELLARIKAILRRTKPQQPSSIQRIGLLDVDFSAQTAMRDGQEIPLTHREFELLRYLISKQGQAVSRDELLEHVWGYDETPTTRTVDNFILRLRKAVEVDPANPKHILTAHGVGYKLV